MCSHLGRKMKEGGVLGRGIRKDIPATPDILVNLGPVLSGSYLYLCLAGSSHPTKFFCHHNPTPRPLPFQPIFQSLSVYFPKGPNATSCSLLGQQLYMGLSAKLVSFLAPLRLRNRVSSGLLAAGLTFPRRQKESTKMLMLLCRMKSVGCSLLAEWQEEEVALFCSSNGLQYT